MEEKLEALLARRGGVVCWNDGVPAWVLKNAVRRGHLRRLYPGVYVAPGATRRRAAARYLDGRGVLSHLTALDLWQLRRQSSNEPVHVTVARRVRLRAVAGIVVHHRQDFELLPVTWQRGFQVVTVPEAIAGSWPLLPPGQRTGAAITAVGRRLTTPEQIMQVLPPKLNGRASLLTLLRLLAEGCRSKLEIWGMLHVFSGPDMPAFRQQFPVRLAQRTCYLDLYAERERVNFELDGAAFHGSREARERDLIRDAELAIRGILVVRYSYARLVSDPAAVRREALAILASRR